MSDTFKTFVGQQDAEPSHSLGHSDNYTLEESYQEIFITYIANNWGMETIDPDICISDRDRRVALIISSLFGTAGANRFYLGYPISACIKSVLERAFNVWWIVDLVRLWMGVFYDANGCILK